MSSIATITAIAAQLSGHAATPASSFADLAFDSLMCIEMVTAVEDATGVDISCHDTIGLETLADMAALVDRRTATALSLAA